VEQLHSVSLSIEKDKHAAVGRIGIEFAAHDPAKSIDAFAHVSGFGVDEDFQLRAEA
jgi:hypothetical protein